MKYIINILSQHLQIKLIFHGFLSVYECLYKKNPSDWPKQNNWLKSAIIWPDSISELLSKPVVAEKSKISSGPVIDNL